MKNIFAYVFMAFSLLTWRAPIEAGVGSTAGLESVKKAGEILNEHWEDIVTLAGGSMDAVSGSVQVLADGSVLVTSILTDGTKEVIKIMTDGSKEIAKILAGGAVETSSKVAIESVTKVVKLGEKFVPVVWVLTGVYALNKTCDMVIDLKNNFSSVKSKLDKTVKDKAEDLKYEEQYALLKARKNLKESLVKNAKGKRGFSGLPEASEEAVKAFVVAAGEEVELEKITEVFKKHFGECSC